MIFQRVVSFVRTCHLDDCLSQVPAFLLCFSQRPPQQDPGRSVEQHVDDNTGKKAMRPLVKNSQSQGQEEQGDRRGAMTDVHGGKQE